MVLKKHLAYQFDKVDKKQITLSNLAITLNCSRTWLSILYNRYKRGEPLEKPRGHRKRKSSSTKEHEE